MSFGQRVPDAGDDVEEIVSALRQVVAEFSDGKLTPDQIDADAHLFDYGYVNSLSAVMFLAHISDHYGVEIEDVALIEEVTTLRAVAERVRAGA